jgi:hypothetical protein
MTAVVISGEPGSAEHFTALLASGDAAAIAAFFQGMPEKDRRTFVKPLRAQLKTVTWRAYQNTDPSQDWSRFRGLQRSSARAQIPAAVAVLADAPAIAKYLRTIQRQNGLDLDADAIRRVLADRAPKWLPELADALSATLESNQLLELVTTVAEVAGVVPAATPGYVRAWALGHQWAHGLDDRQAVFLADPRLAELLPLTFDDDENDHLYSEWATFGKFAVEATAQGKVPRAAVLDAGMRRLLRGGRLGAMQSHLAFWTALAPTDEEIAERISSCVSLLSSQNGTVARAFLASVKRACDAGLVDLELALEAASVAVTRSEKNVVKTTLGWLDALATAHPDRVAEIAGHLAAAFGAPGADLQERAVKLIGKRAGALGEGDRQRLVAEAAVYLAPDLAAKLAALLAVKQDIDTAAAEAGYPDIAPFEPRPLPPPIGSPAELAEEVAALMHGDPAEAMVVERVLEAFVAFARTDAEKLAVALAPVAERQRPGPAWALKNYPQTPRVALFRLAEAAAGRDEDPKRKPHRAPVRQLWPQVRRQLTGYTSVRARTSPADFLILRAAEITAALGLPDLPPLVSVPTAANGIVDPRALAARLREGESEGWVPLEADFHQALLRLPADCGDVDVSGFTSDAGRRFAAWVAGDRVELPAGEPPEPPEGDRARHGQDRSAYLERLARAHVLDPKTLLGLVPGVWSAPERQFDRSDWDVCWPAILPSRPDLCAVALTGGGDWHTVEPSPESAVALAELDDPVHAGTHHVIAARLVHADAPLRASGVDAALVLAARGLLDPRRLAAALTERLAAEPSVGLRRTVPCLRDLANGGAAGQTWETVAALLPAVLPPAVPKAMPGTADLLVTGTELAAALKARTPIEAVTAMAEKKGGSAVANAARRLAGVLGSG